VIFNKDLRDKEWKKTKQPKGEPELGVGKPQESGTTNPDNGKKMLFFSQDHQRRKKALCGSASKEGRRKTAKSQGGGGKNLKGKS